MSHLHVPHPDELKAEVAEFDSALVNSMANTLGSVGFIYFCLGLDAIGFVALVQQTMQALRSHQGLMIVISLWVAFVAQAFIQLVALPVLQNYSNRQQADNAAKADADHQALSYIAEIQDTQLEILKELKEKK